MSIIDSWNQFVKFWYISSILDYRNQKYHQRYYIKFHLNKLILPHKLGKHSAHFSTYRRSRSERGRLASDHVQSSKKTNLVNEVVAGGYLRGDSASVDILLKKEMQFRRKDIPGRIGTCENNAYQADRAVWPGDLLHAFVRLTENVKMCDKKWSSTLNKKLRESAIRGRISTWWRWLGRHMSQVPQWK